MKPRHILALVVALIASSATAQPAKAPRIGVLTFDPATEVFREAFRLGLKERGYIEGKTIFVDWRSADGSPDRAAAHAQQLVRDKVDVIVATPTQAVFAAKNATSTIPIVMAPAGDPVATGFVRSLARPGGNITGITNIIPELGGKLLELVREVKPDAARVALLVGATNPTTQTIVEQMRSAAAKTTLQVQPVMVKVGAVDFNAAFAEISKAKADAVIVQPILATKEVADLAIKHRLLSITTGISSSSYPELGGLMAYGANPAEHYRRAALYVDKILKGAKPADLPVEQADTFQLVVNLKTAKAIGIHVPKSLTLRADRLIE